MAAEREQRTDADFRSGWRLHQEGLLEQAEAIYRRILADAPNHSEVLHLLGVLSHQRGDHTQAAELIARAIAIDPNAPSFHCNLADVLRILGQLESAEASCCAALRLKPDYPEAKHNLALILFKQGRYDEAEEACRRALTERPEAAGTLAVLADCLREQGRLREAAQTYEQALRLSPNLFVAHGNFGVLLGQCGELEKGLVHCRRAVELKPRSALAHHHFGKLLLEYGRVDEAMDELSMARDLGDDSAALAVQVGKAWFELGDLGQARQWFERAAETDPEWTEAHCQLGSVHNEAGDPEGAEVIYRKVLETESQCVDALFGLSRARLEQGSVEDAVFTLDEAIRIRPESANLHAAQGHTLANAGDLERAVECYREALQLNGNCIAALAGLATTLRGKTSDADLVTIKNLLSAPWMTDARRAELHFALAQATDGRGEWEEAARHMATANGLQKNHFEDRGRGYRPEDYRKFVDRVIAGFTPEYFARVDGFGRSSERPVFIVGMPRSGTTLTEQILASHPEVHGAGERRFANLGFQFLPMAMDRKVTPFECLPDASRLQVEVLADWHLGQLHHLDQGRAARVVDKMPENYQHLGWIATLFPRAKIIHCRRDVRDVALSCWITNFKSIRWANELEHIAQRIQEYFRIMEHWRAVLPLSIFEFDYEELVANPEQVSRQLIEFVDLDWNPRCLDFHRTERLVRTASVAQVRQPMYQRSVARWRRYEDALRPLLDRLPAF